MVTSGSPAASIIWWATRKGLLDERTNFILPTVTVGASKSTQAF
jgi:hypothetical protein